jgi:hypothetical protein
VTGYDAAYVALDAPLITAAALLAGFSGPRCAVELVT